MTLDGQYVAGRFPRAQPEWTGGRGDSTDIVGGLLVCFSGKNGSGKTSISRAVAGELGCGRASFGDYLREEIARHGGDPNCREILQDLGQIRIERDAALTCRDVLASGGFVRGRYFVLDGVRHLKVMPHLARLAAPSTVRVIFLEADAGLRSVRVEGRSDTARKDFNRATGHTVEAETEDGLPAAADAIVDGSLPMRQVVEQCIGHIDRWRSAGVHRAAVPRAAGGKRRT